MRPLHSRRRTQQRTGCSRTWGVLHVLYDAPPLPYIRSSTVTPSASAMAASVLVEPVRFPVSI